jgi:sterol desaturase/sphingolipid hydroxylase (fatty acid hydroxylase superfamily)
MKSPKSVGMVAGFVSTVSVIAFVIGLAWSISTGFAGFWGGLPFWIISVTVLAMLVYDYWDECIRDRRNGG